MTKKSGPAGARWRTARPGGVRRPGGGRQEAGALLRQRGGGDGALLLPGGGPAPSRVRKLEEGAAAPGCAGHERRMSDHQDRWHMHVSTLSWALLNSIQFNASFGLLFLSGKCVEKSPPGLSPFSS